MRASLHLIMGHPTTDLGRTVLHQVVDLSLLVVLALQDHHLYLLEVVILILRLLDKHLVPLNLAFLKVLHMGMLQVMPFQDLFLLMA